MDILQQSGYMHKCLLLTDILHSETVILIEKGAVLAAELQAVGDPNGCVVYIKEALPIWINVLWTLHPFTGGQAEWRKQWEKKDNKKLFKMLLAYAHKDR